MTHIPIRHVDDEILIDETLVSIDEARSVYARLGALLAELEPKPRPIEVGDRVILTGADWRLHDMQGETHVVTGAWDDDPEFEANGQKWAVYTSRPEGNVDYSATLVED